MHKGYKNRATAAETFPLSKGVLLWAKDGRGGKIEVKL
jgi:hypothetical protein